MGLGGSLAHLIMSRASGRPPLIRGFLAYLGHLRPLQPTGSRPPFGPIPIRSKGAIALDPNLRWVQNHILDPQSSRAKIPPSLKLAISDHVPTDSSNGLWKTPEATNHTQKSFP
ncbi:hypothetical protein O181_088863 [Austropuccinia psidii MF-1]|uniref:Uncharacterized protein n=1 Tax=Austropuccinia psidii MF-1 TaxID=1389203 RepID=A0A9Q3ISD7_9BASI|nr:hypothetical protein [Austropuccinia psidii MF-1]